MRVRHNTKGFSISVNTANMHGLLQHLWVKLQQLNTQHTNDIAIHGDFKVRYLLNKQLLRDWIKKADRKDTGEALVLQINIVEAVAFYATWHKDAPSNTTLNKIITTIERQLNNDYFKKEL